MSSDSGDSWHQVAVGRLYSPTRTRWPETPHLRLSPAGCGLTLFLNEPSAEEASELATGAVSFAWVDGGPVSVLCFRFGAMSWMDAPFEPWQVPESERGVPAGDPDQYLVLQVTLVEAMYQHSSEQLAGQTTVRCSVPQLLLEQTKPQDGPAEERS
jgi:hypothetical protein